MTHLLIVDDEVHFRNTLSKALRSQGHHVTTLESDERLAATIAINHPDVILLDLMFDSGADGLDICRRLRNWSSIPVIIASVRDDESTIVQLLDAGADDYLIKPFNISELLARVRAVQRRLNERLESKTPLITIDQLTINLDEQMIYLNNEPVHLTQKEFGVMRVLALAGGRVVTYKKMLDAVWGFEGADKYSQVRNVVKRIRRKLNEELSSPKYILTDGTRGYRLGALRLGEDGGSNRGVEDRLPDYQRLD